MFKKQQRKQKNKEKQNKIHNTRTKQNNKNFYNHKISISGTKVARHF